MGVLQNLGDMFASGFTGQDTQDVIDKSDLMRAQMQNTLADVPLRGAQTQKALADAETARTGALKAAREQEARDRVNESAASGKTPALGDLMEAGYGDYSKVTEGVGHNQDQGFRATLASPTATGEEQRLASQGVKGQLESPYLALPAVSTDIRDLAPAGAPPKQIVSDVGGAHITQMNAAATASANKPKIGGMPSPEAIALRGHKIATGEMPVPTAYEFTRNPDAAYAVLAAAQAENPSVSAQDLPSELQTLNAFNKGVPAQKVTALNTAMNHLETMHDLGVALKNGNMTSFNNVAQFFAQQTGEAAPTNAQEAAEIVGNEVMKSVVNSGAGTGPEREKLQEAFGKARSPDQMEGAIKTARHLLAGQAASMALQYKNGTKKDDFYDRNPVLRELTGGATTGRPTAATDAAAPAAATATPPPPAALVGLAEGAKRTFKNGQVWMMQGGKPVQVH